MNVFTKAFFLKALEASLLSGATTFTGIVTIQGAPSLHALVGAATATGLAVLYTFLKEYSVVQAVKQGIVGVVSSSAGKHTSL